MLCISIFIRIHTTLIAKWKGIPDYMSADIHGINQLFQLDQEADQRVWVLTCLGFNKGLLPICEQI